MSVQFTLSSKTKLDTYKDSASIGDAITYSFDLTPWQEDNSNITSVSWSVEGGYGNASISNESLVGGIASALITFNQRGKSLVAIQINSATQKKKVWLEVNVKDLQIQADDYGICDC